MATVKRFLDLRKKLRKDKGESGKKASTSELLDWFLALLADERALEKLQQTELPYAEALLKTRMDFLRYQKPNEARVHE